jgi:hypothetical protein
MSDTYTKLSDTLSSKEGRAYITINGSNRKMFEVSKLEATLELSIHEKQLLGHRMKQHKIVGAEGTGSMTYYFMNSQMANSAIDYVNSGKFTGFTIQAANEDQQSTVGKNEVVLYNVIPKKFPLVHIDDSSDDPITVDTDFTFDSVSSLSSFNLPTNYQ